MEDVIVIGAGASGMMAALVAAQNHARVVLLEKMPSCGKKLRITGKGRCNVTTTKSRDEILGAIRRNAKFMYSALSAFDNKDVYAFFEAHGCPLKVEQGDRVFPVSDHAQDVIDTLLKAIKAQRVQIVNNMAVRAISRQEDGTFCVQCESRAWTAATVIICTGGATYPGTGSTGDGYRWLEDFGLKIEPVYPALVPLVSRASWVKSLQGLSLRNVGLCVINEKGKTIYKDQGEMLFTHFGISGPIVLSASGHCASYWQKESAPLVAHIDMKPALSIAQLDARLLREIDGMPNKSLVSMMKTLLPQKMVPVFIEQIGLDADKKLHQLTKEERQIIAQCLKDLPVPLWSTRPLEEGIVTAGGLSVKEVQPKTMAVKKVPGLFVAGEILDVDAYTGGFNLQIAFSSGYSAGKAASAYVLEREN